MKTRRLTKGLVKPLVIALATVGLTACLNDDNNGTDRSVNNNTVSGVLIQPETVAETSAQVMAASTLNLPLAVNAATACESVPEGYEPLANIVVSLTDDLGTVLAELTTDECGLFSGEAPAEVTLISATPANSKPISAPVSNFQGTSEPTPVSTFQSDATLIISVIQDLGNGKLAMTVTDSASGKPVLGLAEQNFSFLVNTVEIEESSVVYGAATAQAATASLTLDASSSMDEEVFTDSNDVSYTAFQLAAQATHEFLDGLQTGSDEAGIVIFDDEVYTMNDSELAKDFAYYWADSDGNFLSEPFQFSETGLTTDYSLLRPVVDMYNPFSKIYNNRSYVNTVDEVHPDVGNLRLNSAYYWASATAFYDGVKASLAQVQQGSNARKLIIAMTDGQDNSSANTIQDIVAESNSLGGIPIYTVAFGSERQVDENDLQELAQLTGGEYKRVEGTDLTGLFQSIQTGIRFQYVVSFPDAFGAADMVEATVSLADTEISRQLTIQP